MENSTPKLGTALLKKLLQVQAALQPAKKDSKNPHFNRTYASLDAVWAAARPALQSAGLVLLQPHTLSETGVAVRTIIADPETGELIDGVTPMPVAGADPQKFGSAYSYARRYGLASLLVIVADDDDDAEYVAQDARYERLPERRTPQASPPAEAPRKSGGLLGRVIDLKRESPHADFLQEYWQATRGQAFPRLLKELGADDLELVERILLHGADAVRGGVS